MTAKRSGTATSMNHTGWSTRPGQGMLSAQAFSAYLYHYSIEKCLRYGMANAGSVVGSYGASTGLLDQTVAEDYGKHIHATLLAAR